MATGLCQKQPGSYNYPEICEVIEVTGLRHIQPDSYNYPETCEVLEVTDPCQKQPGSYNTSTAGDSVFEYTLPLSQYDRFRTCAIDYC